MKKLTVTLPDDVHEGLQRVVGPHRIGRFLADIVRPRVVRRDLLTGYRAMAAAETREREALDWSDELIEDLPIDRD